jgi:hypothetical protein
MDTHLLLTSIGNFAFFTRQVAGFIALAAIAAGALSITIVIRVTSGLAGTLLNGFNDRSKGLFDRLSKSRSNAMSDRHQRRMAGKLGFFGGANGRGAAAYQRIAHIGTPNSGAFQSLLPGGVGRNGRRQYGGFRERMNAAHREGILKEPGVNETMMDDVVRGVLAVGENRADDFLRAKGVTVGSNRYQEVMGMAQSIGFSASSRLAALQGESTHGKGRNMAAIRATYGAANDSVAMRALVNNIGRETGMNGQGVDRLLQTTMYNFGQSSRGDLRQETVADVLDKKYDTQIAGTAGDAAIGRIADEMTARINSGTAAQKLQTAAQILATQESVSRMSEPTRQVWTESMKDPTGVAIDYSSATPIEIQLATRIAGVSPGYNANVAALGAAENALRIAQQNVNDEVAERGAAGPAAVASLQAARAAVDARRTILQPEQSRITALAQEIRATSSTYSSSIPYGARETP